MTILKHIKINIIIKYNAEKYYLINLTKDLLTAKIRNWVKKIILFKLFKLTAINRIDYRTTIAVLFIKSENTKSISEIKT